MQFNATAKYIRFSPYKLRPLVNVVRGKSVPVALQWLETYKVGRVRPILKLIKSAAANALSLKQVQPENLVIHDILEKKYNLFFLIKKGWEEGKEKPRNVSE